MIEFSSGVDTLDGEKRVSNALQEAFRLRQSGHDVRLIFDGAGTRWLPEIIRTDHELHGMFSDLRDRAPAACRHCAKVFGVENAIRDAGIILLDDYHNHSKLNGLISQKYQTITF